MSYKEKNIENVYYSISEAADLLECNKSKVRYYCKLINMRVNVNRHGDRFFTLPQIKEIYRLINLGEFMTNKSVKTSHINREEFKELINRLL